MTMKNLLILGTGRAGTSMLAGTLAPAGYHFGDNLVEPRQTNPKGFFESRVINALNERIMAPGCDRLQANADPATREHLPGPKQRWLVALPPDAPLADNAPLHSEIAQHTSRTPFCYKDPRFCYTLDRWRPHLPEDTVMLCIFRHPDATARSILREIGQARYLANVRLTYDQVLDLWIAMYRRVLAQHRHRGRWAFFHYRQLLTQAGLDRLAEVTGATLDRRFPESRLQRHRPEPDGDLPPEAESLYRQLRDLAGD